MLDIYRNAEAVKINATDKKAKLYDNQTLSFLKKMEKGPKHPDAKMLNKVVAGKLKDDSKELHDYLVKRLNEVPHLL